MGLLSALFGHHDPTVTNQQTGVPAPPPQMDPAAHPAVGSLVQHLATVAPTSALTQPAPNPQSPITVTGQAPPADTWQPHKAGLLGQIADYLLDTHFGKENWRRNMSSAMENIDKDPMTAVKRIAKFDPATAEAMYEKVVDNQRADGAQNRLNRAFDLSNQKNVDGQVGAMMYAAAKSGNPAAYQAARNRAIEQGGRYGIDYTTLPENPTPEDIEMLGMGQIPAAKQMAVGEQHSNHKLQHQDRLSGQAIQRERNGIMARQGDARIGIAQENADTAGQNADTADFNAQTGRMRANHTIDKDTVRTVHVPGKPGYGQTVKGNPNQMIWYLPNGTKHLYLSGKNKNDWHYAHQMAGKNEKIQGVEDPNASDNANEN
jgi:hypothetical protein